MLHGIRSERPQISRHKKHSLGRLQNSQPQKDKFESSSEKEKKNRQKARMKSEQTSPRQT